MLKPVIIYIEHNNEGNNKMLYGKTSEQITAEFKAEEDRYNSIEWEWEDDGSEDVETLLTKSISSEGRLDDWGHVVVVDDDPEVTLANIERAEMDNIYTWTSWSGAAYRAAKEGAK